jgi:hypothetical protein
MSDQSPAPGDLLISKRNADGHFEISIVPGRPQVALAQQHDAVMQAHAFAVKSGGAVWMTNGNGSVVRLQSPKHKES